MAQGDLDVKLTGEGEDEIGQLIGTFNRMAEAVRFNVERARENEARFHATADYTHDLEFWLSPEGKLLWVNPSVERMLGYSVGECMGQMNFPPTSSTHKIAPQPSSSCVTPCAAPPARVTRCGFAARMAAISGQR
ncbi:MAG: HAMP domain-containing protein [Thiobacillus sp.]|nr:HAMP domain-containing protein [Thiobacillus sp.]MDP2057181.1 HAMP domain-containing protein [Thiobacillus sp.]